MPQFNHQSWISHTSGWVISVTGKTLVLCADTVYPSPEGAMIWPCSESTRSGLSLSVIFMCGPWHLKLYSLVTLNTENIHGVTMTHPQNAKGINSQNVFLKIRHHGYLWQRSDNHFNYFYSPLEQTSYPSFKQAQTTADCLGFILSSFLVTQTFDTLSIPASEHRGRQYLNEYRLSCQNKFLTQTTKTCHRRT